MEIEKDLPKELQMEYLISCIESVQESFTQSQVFALVVSDISEENFDQWVNDGVWSDDISLKITNAVRNFSSNISQQMAA